MGQRLDHQALDVAPDHILITDSPARAGMRRDRSGASSRRSPRPEPQIETRADQSGPIGTRRDEPGLTTDQEGGSSSPSGVQGESLADQGERVLNARWRSTFLTPERSARDVSRQGSRARKCLGNASRLSCGGAAVKLS
jgi:hypothetical protein